MLNLRYLHIFASIEHGFFSRSLEHGTGQTVVRSFRWIHSKDHWKIFVRENSMEKK